MARTQARGMCKGCGYTGTKASMTRHLAACKARFDLSSPPQSVYRLRITSRYSSPYWLDVQVRENSTLGQLDHFLRSIWLECCGHLSEFNLEGRQLSNSKKWSALPSSIILEYTYDFGSSTDLIIKVVAQESAPHQGTAMLLARNLPPLVPCRVCLEAATQLCAWDWDDETGGPFSFCDLHAQQHIDAVHDGDEAALLPLVNSPRAGVCGYEGPSQPCFLDKPPLASQPVGY